MKIAKRIIQIIIGAAILLVFVIYGIPAIKNILPGKKGSDNFFVDTASFQNDMEAYTTGLANKQSDIDGWTKLDKMEAGLRVDDGADTDGDGLTDKDEIEIYGSNPKARSTAGDLYTDGYKVQNGMDIFSQYPREDIDFAWNECDDISFSAVIEDDLWAVAQDVTGQDLIDGYDIIKEYRVYNCAEPFEIDAHGVDEDITVLISTISNREPQKIKVEKNGNRIKITEDLDRGMEYYVFLAKSKKKFGLSMNAGDATPSEIGVGTATGDGLVYHVILTTFFGWKPQVYFVPTGNDAQDEILMDELALAATNMIDEEIILTREDCQIVSQAKLDFIKNICSIFPQENCHYSPYVAELPEGGWLFQYFDLADISDHFQKVEQEKKGSKQGFDVYVDELRFPNIATELSDGLCAGFAGYTMILYNTGSFPAQGEYNGRSWDLSNDIENATLLDKGLADYKTAGFSDKYLTEYTETVNSSGGDEAKITRSIMDKTQLSDGEKEFVSMLEAEWEYFNSCKRGDIKEPFVSNYDYALIDEMKRILDSGKILYGGFAVRQYDNAHDRYLKTGDPNPDSMEGQMAGHAINIIGYTESKSNPDVTYFRVYDCNYPLANEWEDASASNILTVTRRKEPWDHEDTFSYYYSPNVRQLTPAGYEIKGGYGTGSEMEYYYFCILDENGNCLSEAY